MTIRKPLTAAEVSAALKGLSPRTASPLAYHALEPRIAFDAAGAAVAAEVVDPGATPAAGAPPEASGSEPAAANDMVDALAAQSAMLLEDAGHGASIVFIDSAVGDPGVIAAAVPAGAEIVMLSADRDGLAQIADYVRGRSGIGAIHIVSHGEAGEVTLGGISLTAGSIAGEHADEIATIASALSADADILLYGCDVAEGTAGAAFLTALATASTADVAASTDDTGAANFGGDWQLEAATGAIEAAALDASDWNGLLAPMILSASSAPTVTGGTGIGAMGLWTNAGSIGGVPIDVTATVISMTGSVVVGFQTTGDDLRVTLSGSGSAVIRWAVFQAETSQTVIAIGDPNFTVRDLDGLGGVGQTIEGVGADLTGLSSYSVANPTNLVLTNNGTTVRADGTQNQNGDEPSWIRFSWANRSTWEAEYFCYNPAAGTRFYDHDGDGDFTFSGTPTTTAVPVLDLDLSDGTATGTAYAGTYEAGSAGVAVVDSDVTIGNATSLLSASVTLTNPQAGDTLSIAGVAGTTGTVPGTGIAFSITGGAVSFTGVGTQADYQTALQSVRFAAVNGAGINRAFDIGVVSTVGAAQSDFARSTITVTNTAPVANPDTATVVEDQSVSGSLIANDTDANPGQTLTVTAASIDTDGNGVPDAIPLGTPVALTTAGGVAIGTLTVAADGTYSFTPAADYNGAVPDLTYTTSDGNSGTDTATLTLTITPVDDPITASPLSPQATGEDTPLVFSTANGNAIALSDPDGVSGTNVVATLRLPDGYGTLRLATTAGLDSVSGNGTREVIVTGSVAAVNAALDGLTFTPVADSYGAIPVAMSIVTTRPVQVGFVNAGFEQQDFPDTNTFRLTNEANVPGWETSATDNMIEVWDSGFQGVPAFEGDQFVELNANQVSTLSQTFTPMASGGDLTLTFAHRGRSGVDTMNVTAIDLGADGVLGGGDDTTLHSQNYSTGNTAWQQYQVDMGTASGNPILLQFNSVAAAGGNRSVGNFLDAISIYDSSLATSIDVGITVTPVVDITDDAVTTAEDTPITFNVLTGTNGATEDTFEGAPQVTATTLPANGTISVLASGQITYTPTVNFHGTDTFTYTVTSPAGITETATVTVTVTPVNDLPAAIDDAKTVTEDTPASGNVLTDAPGADTDADGNTLTVSGFTVGGVNYTPGQTATLTGVGTLTIGTDGGYTFTPEANYDGAVPIVTYAISDGNGGSDTAKLTLTMVPVNDRPVVIDPTNPGTPENPTPAGDPANIIPDVATVDSATPPAVDVSAYIADPEGNPLTYTATGLPTGLTLDSVTGIISGTLPADASQGGPNTDGIYPVTVTVTDSGGLSTTTTITYTVTNPSPIAVDDVGTVTEDIPATGNVLTDGTDDSDPDGDTIAVTAFEIDGATYTAGQTATLPGVGTLVVNANGSYTFTPAPNYAGAVPVATYTIADTDGATDTATLTLTLVPVNDRPVVIDTANPGTPLNPIQAPDPANIIPDVTTADSLTPPTIQVADYIRDPEGQPLTYTATGLPTGLTLDPVTGIISGTLPADASQGGPNTDGVYPVTVTVTDTGGLSTTTTITYTVTNPSPVAVDDVGTVTEDIPAIGNVLTDGTDDSDPDGDTIAVTAFEIDGATYTAGQTATLVGIGTLVVNANGSYTFTPVPNYAGAIPVATYTIADSDGGSDTATLTLTLVPTNDPPVAVDDASSMGEDVASVAGNVITGPGTDTDLDSAVLTVTAATQGTTPLVIGQPFTTAGGGVLTLNANGSYSFVPGTAYNGLDAGETAIETISYTIDDGSNGIDTAILVITVQGANDAPVIVDPANPGTDPENPVPADPATIIPTQNVTDGGAFTAAAPLVDVSDFVVDPDAETMTFSTTSVLPAGLTLNPDGTVTGTIGPDASQGGDPANPGVYTVTVAITDGTATTNVTLIIDVSNLLPVAVDDANSIGEDAVSVVGNVILDPVTGDADTAPDSDPLTVVSALEGTTPLVIGQPFTTAGGGVLTLNADGSYTFAPGTAYNGLDAGETAAETITYTVSDGNGGTDTATLVITVNGANDAPVIIDPTNPVNNPDNPAYDPENPIQATDPLNIIPDVSTTDGQPLTPIDVAAVVRDPDGEPLTFTLDPTTTPTWVTIDPVTGVITGTPPANASQGTNTGTPGEYLITITATDPDGAVVTTTVTLAIVNLPPVAQNDTVTTDENAPATGNVLADNGNGPDAETGPDTDPVRVGGVITGLGTPVEGVGLATPVPGDNGGTFTVGPDGSYTFDPGTAFDDLASGEIRTTTVTYLLVDGNGGSDTATLTVTVTGTNDAPQVIDPATGAPPVDPATGLPVDPTVVDVVPPIAGNDSSQITPVPVGAYFRDLDTTQGPPALSVDPTALPPGITFDLATGTFEGTPTSSASQGGNVPGQPGVYRVPVTATDPSGASVTTFVTFRIGDPLPVAVDDTGIVTDENRAVTFPVLGNDADPDGDPIRVTGATSPDGVTTVNPDGTLSFTPNPGFVGTARLTYTITDDEGGTATAVAEVTVRSNGYVAPPAPPALAAPALTAFAPLPGADGAVDVAVNGGQVPGDTGDGIAADGEVLDAVDDGGAQDLFDQDAALDLGGTPALAADGAVLQESARITRLWQPERAFDRPAELERFDVDPISGFSLTFGALDASAGTSRFVVESIVRDGVLMLMLRDRAVSEDGRAVTDYRVTRADGRALPDWLERPSFDLVQGRRPVDGETIDLRITATLDDGTLVTQTVRIQGSTGEIQPLAGPRAEATPQLFLDQIEASAQPSDAEVEALAALLTAAPPLAAE